MNAARRPGGLGLAIASLVLGILAICLSFLLVGGLLGFVGLVLGIIHLWRRSNARGLAWWGSGLAAVGLALSITFGVLYYRIYQQIRVMMESASGSIAEWEGVEAPELSLTTLDGKEITLADFKGKRVVLDFWATWCPPCRKEIPHFIQLAKETSPDELVIIGISNEDPDVIRAFAAKQGINYPLACVSNLPAPYNAIRSIPTTLFIDRRGVIQDVAVGYHDFAALKRRALQPDYQGTPKPPPSSSAPELRESSASLVATSIWNRSADGLALAVGNWADDGQPRILVADTQRRLRVLTLTGEEERSLPLPDTFHRIECGRHRDKGARLLGYSVWSKELVVLDRNGNRLWSYRCSLGINGAHWGDLDGDGTDEVIIGMNGFGGLHAVNAEGRLLWKVTNIGNVWNQAVVSASTNRPALVFATEAAGSIRVYDAAGKPLRTLRPQGRYFAQMTAAVMDDNNTVQVIANGEAKTMAFDPQGTVAWVAPARRDPGGWRLVSFAAGDLTGDGRFEWVFCDDHGDPVVVSADGEKLATIPVQGTIDSLAVASVAGKPGVLLTLKDGAVRAYRCKPADFPD